MSRLLYLDCFSGISGDMVLGALLDAGLPLQDLKRALGSLALAGCEVGATRVLRAGLSATKFVVQERHESPEHGPDEHDHHQHPGRRPAHRHEHSHRTLPEIFALIDQSALSHAGRDRAKGLFRRLAEAEAAIHQTPAETVHLHEVGALDSIIDIVGAVFALEWVGAWCRTPSQSGDAVVCMATLYRRSGHCPIVPAGRAATLNIRRGLHGSRAGCRENTRGRRPPPQAERPSGSDTRRRTRSSRD